MNMIANIQQGSDEWRRLRLGKVTASCFSAVLSKGKGSAPSKTRHSYMLQLAAEIITGEPQDNFTNKYMEWGNQCEPQARSMYEFDTSLEVEEVGFIEHNDHVGVSPDGMVGDSGMLEIKCPKTTTQIERYLAGNFPACYKAQVQGQLWVAEREWSDFVSFDPRINSSASFFKIRVDRDDEYIGLLRDGVYKFVDELLALIEKIR